MDLLSFRAFVTDVTKIAAEVQDPDIRALLADRQGKEYLPGGQLPSNSPAETNFKPKIAGSIMVPVDVLDLKARTKRPGHYQDARDWATTGLKGAMIGGSATKLYEKVRGAWSPGGRGPEISGKGYLGAALGGAAAATADRLYRHHQAKKQGLIKTALLGVNFSPAKALQATGQVGKFEHTVHMGTPARIGLSGPRGT